MHTECNTNLMWKIPRPFGFEQPLVTDMPPDLFRHAGRLISDAYLIHCIFVSHLMQLRGRAFLCLVATNLETLRAVG